ncbi:glycoside hydrolase family 2 protein [Aaosphaeria arxii CBS 175.79]|uniref:Glycoside hydrolase family 2 protein n=1 Tax=Aaosphaeria arxii CBS 175.79 TaxID=1450172 RepID=A0A6A5Y4E6_9PLEO|nr:glycoside hydrolase family 2 protein [Aaosphaeria arxii CBS 175.79]KAF2020126.1 glycoside hydrolase family 2 protein [Aaosphaeria arxii CBS 175.79]
MRLSIGIISLFWATTVLASSNSRFFKRVNNTGYELKKGPLDTPWTEEVGTDPWPEYPRPQRQRSDWKNLNGVWQYRNASDGEIASPPFGQDLGQSVLVPFCLESALSGIMAKWAIWSWYRTTFEVPSDWNSDNRVLLTFGAVDYEATIFVNQKNVTFHRGGYFEFTVDVTDYLSVNGTNELVVHVYDPTDKDLIQIPIGKQTLEPSHIFYTPCSGIWQTVWLESAPISHVTQLDISADMEGNVNVTVHASGNQTSGPVDITIYEPGSDEIISVFSGESNSPFQFKVDSPKLWSPDSPTLYNLTVELDGGKDVIHSYTGFRTISRGEVDGVQRPLLNGEFVFQFGTLDQGYWPDGLHTPPNKEAMVYDIQTLKKIGYNMLRKHIKIENSLFYRACDELGLLLIQDMPSLRPSVPASTAPCSENLRTKNEEVQKEFERQLDLFIEQHKSYPSIITWVIYNEGWGQEKKRELPELRLTDHIRSLDPTRLINAASGWDDHGAGDFHDNHHYANPQCGTPFYSTPSTPYDPKRIGIQGEFGGIGHNLTAENLWKVEKAINEINGTYEIDATLEHWNYRAHILLSELRDQIEKFACSAAIWTQTTDVEGEVNGMLSYDRRILRPDLDQWKADIQALYDAASARGGRNYTMVQVQTGF